MTPDATELLDDARCWQKQFHDLQILVESHTNYRVGYGCKGEVILTQNVSSGENLTISTNLEIMIEEEKRRK